MADRKGRYAVFDVNSIEELNSIQEEFGRAREKLDLIIVCRFLRL